MAKPALGRGLGALLSGNPLAKPPVPPSAPAASPAVEPQPDARERVRHVALTQVKPCAFQPRKDFSPEALKELADSIREQGIVQPLIVRESNGSLELIAGERRWRAAQIAGLKEVPVIVREADDRAVLELALIENLQRENLNPIEEALGYSQLIENFKLTQEETAVKVGKSRTVVANALRLLKLPTVIQGYVREGKVSVGHAKVILGLAAEKQQRIAVERILKDGLNVRQTEALVARWQERPTGPAATPAATSPAANTHVARIENKLREKLGTRVQVRYANGKGAVEISFFNDDDLDRILQVLGINPD